MVPVLLVAYDSEYPQPLHDKRPIPDAFGIALVLTPERREDSVAKLTARIQRCEFRSDWGMPRSRRCAAARRLPAQACRCCRCWQARGAARH